MGMTIVFLVLSCLAIVLLGTRHAWMQRQCPACRCFVPGLATQCLHCHTALPPRATGRVVSGLLLGLCLGADAQAFSLLPCHRISFVDEACRAEEPAAAAEALPVQAPLPPLFPRETLAPSASPLLVQLANTRTLEHARTYVRWRAARTAAHDDVQRLIQHAQQELERERPHAR